MLPVVAQCILLDFGVQSFFIVRILIFVADQGVFLHSIILPYSQRLFAVALSVLLGVRSYL